MGGRDLQHLEYAVARILAETDRPVEVYDAVLEVVGETLGWVLGAVWEVRRLDARLHCIRTWHSEEGAPEFAALSERMTMGLGEGLPGRVVVSGEPAWIIDVREDRNFPRSEIARGSGLHAAFGFPLASPRGTVGVMEFFSRERLEPDETLLRTVGVLGSQIGQFVVRRQAEDAVRESEARNRAILDSALDAVITMDHRGHVVEFNPAAERIFGYAAEDAIGREMADLVVPPSLRDRHRSGLARYLETETATLLDRRLEITAMRADGTEFPVELTITRIDVPGPATFTGYVRDITDRLRAEEELKTSRARIVEAADDERRRIERNLHDGAQQHLVSLALRLRSATESLEDGDPAAARELLEQVDLELAVAIEELRELAQGIHPAVLSERGLRPALEGLASRSPLAVRIAALPDERLPPAIEVASYYLVAECLTNAVKHARATTVTVRVDVAEDTTLVEVADDGIGGVSIEGSSGLRGLADRVAALGGRLAIESPPGAGTRVRAEIPL
jgi:PAS domain S-box-containing protein